MSTNPDTPLVEVEKAPADGSVVESSDSVRDPHRVARWFRRPRGLVAEAVIALACACTVLVAFAPVLFDGKTLSTATTALGVNGGEPFPGSPPPPRDSFHIDRGASAWQFEPWAEVTHREYAAGRVPLWNPYQGVGAPLAANMQSAALDPLLAPVNLHPTPLTWDLTLTAAFAAGAALAYAAARAMRIGRIGAAVAATVFGLSGYFQLYANNPFARAYIYLPLIVLGVELILRFPSRLWPLAVVAAGVTGNVLIGMPEASVATITTAGVYALLRVLFGDEGHRWRSVARLGAAGVVGLLLAAPLLLPLREYVGVAHTSHGAERRIGEQAEPVRTLLNWVVPFFNGMPWDTTLKDGFSGTRNWIGGAAAALSLSALASTDRRTRAPRLALSFGGLLLILKVYDFQIFEWVGHLPIFERTAFPFVFPAAIGFLLAMLAGLGVDGVQRSSIARRRLAVAFVVAGLVAFLLLTWEQNRRYVRATTGTYALRHFGLAAGGILLVALAILGLKRRPRWAVGACTAMVIIELMMLASNAVYANRADPYVAPSWLKALKQDAQAKPYDRIIGLDGKLFPNIAGAFELHEARVIDALYVKRYFEYIRAFLQPLASDRFVGGPYAAHEPRFARYLHNPLFDALGVRYIISREPLSSVGATPLLLRALGNVHPDEALRLATIDVQGDARAVLFQHPDRDVELPKQDGNHDRLALDYTVDPAAFSAPDTDGVRFELVVVEGNTERLLWGADFVPRADPRSPEWRHAEIPIDAAARKALRLILRTRVRGSSAVDWAGWSGLQYLKATESSSSAREEEKQFTLVAKDGDTRVYRYSGGVPRAWVVRKAHFVEGPENVKAALARRGWTGIDGAIAAPGFDPLTEVILEAKGESGDLRTCRRAAAEDRAFIVSHESDRVEITVRSACSGYLILSDAYFPGWHATVNGASSEILPANLAFRAVAIPAGTSRVVFVYRPWSFRNGLVLSALTLLVVVIALIQRDIRPRKQAVG